MSIMANIKYGEFSFPVTFPIDEIKPAATKITKKNDLPKYLAVALPKEILYPCKSVKEIPTTCLPKVPCI